MSLWKLSGRPEALKADVIFRLRRNMYQINCVIRTKDGPTQIVKIITPGSDLGVLVLGWGFIVHTVTYIISLQFITSGHQQTEPNP